MQQRAGHGLLLHHRLQGGGVVCKWYGMLQRARGMDLRGDGLHCQGSTTPRHWADKVT